MKKMNQIQEALSAFAGQKFYALVSRMGGKFRDIHALAVYEVTPNGTTRKCYEAINCVANKESYVALDAITGGKYVKGRPTPIKALEHLHPMFNPLGLEYRIY